MNTKDKLITIFGALVILGSSIGVYTWVLPGENKEDDLGIKDFFDVSSSFSSLPSLGTRARAR